MHTNTIKKINAKKHMPTLEIRDKWAHLNMYKKKTKKNSEYKHEMLIFL